MSRVERARELDRTCATKVWSHSSTLLIEDSAVTLEEQKTEQKVVSCRIVQMFQVRACWTASGNKAYPVWLNTNAFEKYACSLTVSTSVICFLNF